MTKIYALFAIALINIGLHAQTPTITLRNGANVSKQRVEQVYNSLNVLCQHDSLEYYWLWRTAKKCQQLSNINCVLATLFQEADRHYLKPLSPETINFLEQQGIIKAGVLDKETQDIILSSYRGTGEPKLVGIRYPVSTLQKMAFTLKNIWD